MSMNKSIPILYAKKEDCCGCTACFIACPKKAIYMQEDEKGFYYPHIKSEKCISCYKCIKICPVK